jgi:hypothetical protein
MNDTERLLAIEEIKQLKARYYRGIDTRDWELFGDVFIEDAVMDMSGAHNDSVHAGEHIHTTRDEIVHWIREIQAKRVASMHHGHTPEITIVSDNEAEGIWAGAWNSILKDPEPDGPREFRGAGIYFETYRKEADGKWRIATLRARKYYEWLT